MYALFFSKNFKDDVQQSINYIKYALQAPVAAERLKEEIKRVYKNIKDTPFMYPVVPNDYLASMGFRFTMVKNYMLFYIVEEK
jgi:plasmid stabilization system protein ParE